ncbi:hypothetical protein [Nannocystis pusilla]|uniref:hypothetical protein n=1 Tax=Nannocystis pusilla TaxID=889268 RepID=UPI003DA2268A
MIPYTIKLQEAEFPLRRWPGNMPRIVDAVTLGESTPFGAGSIPLLHDDGQLSASGACCRFDANN